jgi:hypothetical protein
MAAVLIARGAQPGSGWAPFNSTAPPSRTNGITLEGLALDAHGLADFGMFAPALTRSRFIRSSFQGARVAGLYIGYGWINDVVECDFVGRTMVGLYLDFGVNSINVLNSQWEPTKGEMGVGIVVNTGSMVRIEGNTLEGLAGPSIIANQVRMSQVYRSTGLYLPATSRNHDGCPADLACV